MEHSLIERYAELDEKAKDLENRAKAARKDRAELEEAVMELFMELGVKSVQCASGKTVHLHRQLWANARMGEDDTRDFRAACGALKGAGYPELVETKFNTTRVSALIRELERSEDGIPFELQESLDITEKVQVRVRR